MGALDEYVQARTFVREVVDDSGSSFSWGMRVLPRRRRRAIYAVYTFARLVDNVADGPGAPQAKQRALSEWRREVDRLFAGVPQHPVTLALKDGIHEFGLPKEEFHALISGMERDAQGRVRIKTTGELFRYCRQVAGSVGVLCIHIFGLSQPPGRRFALALGNAFQLTNILRDVQEDLGLDRLYLPQDLLARYGAWDEQVTGLLERPGVAPACAALAQTALHQFAEAKRYMQELPWWRTRPPALMKVIYEDTLRCLMAHGWRRWDRGVRPSAARRVWLILRDGLR